MQRVEVNEPTADELVNPTLEEELEMQEKARENKNTTEKGVSNLDGTQSEPN